MVSTRRLPSATGCHPVNGQIYSYGYNATDATDATDANGNTLLLSEPQGTFDGGNTDLRSP
jgi:hypothetical protein